MKGGMSHEYRIKQLRAAIRLPGNSQKSYKFFCRGLDIRVAQTVNFLPYITTPVAIGLIFSFLFDWSTGIVNKILMGLGLIDKGMNWLGDPKLAYFVVAFMIIWKSTGYYMAIYLAGITSISEDVFEAARADLSGREPL